MTEKLLASIIIPVRNGERVISRCLQALSHQTIPTDCYEILVIDDGSTDRTAEIAAPYRVISQTPSGPSVARNRGAQEAKAPILLFTDADCTPKENWVESLLTPFQDPQVMGVKGTYESHQKSLTARFVQLEYESKYERMKQFDNIDFIDTYSAGFRRDLFLDSGGYDPAYGTASVEDQEFSFRLHEKGAKLLFVPGAIVEHLHVDYLFGYFRKKLKIGFFKALLLFQHPGKIMGDTHTPKSLQFQVLLIIPLLLSVLFSIWLKPALFALLSLGGLFFITMIPFLLGVIKKGEIFMGLISPIYITTRSLALSLGLLKGSILFGFSGKKSLHSKESRDNQSL